MQPVIKTEKNGKFTHYFLVDHRVFSGELYIGISCAAPRNDSKGKSCDSFTQTGISFAGGTVTDDTPPFLPGSVVVQNVNVMTTIMRAAEWYQNELDIYTSAQLAIERAECPDSGDGFDFVKEYEESEGFEYGEMLGGQ